MFIRVSPKLIPDVILTAPNPLWAKNWSNLGSELLEMTPIFEIRSAGSQHAIHMCWVRCGGWNYKVLPFAVFSKL